MTSLSRREFLQVMAAAAALGLSSSSRGAEAESALYAVPPFGNVHFLHLPTAMRSLYRYIFGNRHSISGWVSPQIGRRTSSVKPC
jgi:hypothetical protein